MISSNIAKRYARAFFEIAKGDKQYEKYYEELRQFSSILEENKGLKELFLNPVFGQAEKKAVLNSILQKVKTSTLTANFINLLVDKRRIGALNEIEVCYRSLMDEALKRTRVSVITAFPLSAELTAALRERLESMTGKKVEMAITEDATLIGGLVVAVGDTLYDGSIKTQLYNIRNLLGEEI